MRSVRGHWCFQLGNLSHAQNFDRYYFAGLQVTQILQNLRQRGAVGSDCNSTNGENDVAADKHLFTRNGGFVSAANETDRGGGRVVGNALDQQSRRLRNVE